MSHTNKIIYTRPNAETGYYTPKDEYLNKIEEYFSSGKIIQKPTKVEDGLTITFTIVYKDTDSYLDFKEEPVVKNNHTARAAYCSGYSISYDLQSDV